MSEGERHRFHRRRLLHLRARIALAAKRLPSRLRLRGGLEHGLMAVVAALLAYLPARAVGFHQGYWGAITAIAVVQNGLEATQNTARDQFTGAAIGGLVGGALVAIAAPSLLSYALAVLVAILACWVANVSSAARLAGSTVTIILLVPHDGPALQVVLARVGEVAWGITCALAVVWIGSRLMAGNTAKANT